MQTSFIQIKNQPDLLRDMKHGGIVNKNSKALEAAKKQKNYVLDIRNKLQETENEVKILRSDVADLKGMFSQAMERFNK